jgi:multiple sugar transport system substrate-binding protein
MHFQKHWIVLSIALIVAFVLSACAPPAAPPPIKETVVVTQPGPVVKETVQVPVTVAPVKKTVVEFWSTDNEEQRVNVYEQVAAKFMAKNPDIEVRIVPIDEATVSQRIATARGANRLPAIVRMGVERVSPFYADGILDADAATKVINDLGKDDFYAGPLKWVETPDGKYAAVPFDGWLQAIWYRADEFKKLNLTAPIKWDDIKNACETIKGKDGYLYGITLGTDPGQNYGQQVFEQFAMSNNAWPFDKDGNVTMNSPQMIEALKFYTSLQDCAAPGPNYWQQGRQFYITGQSAMLFYSTYVMDDLAGLQKGVEPTVKDLATNTGFAPEMVGQSGDKATYGQLVTFSIMKGPASDAAVKVVEFFLSEGYQDILALSPNGKIPVRKSAVADWKKNEIFASYPPDVLETVANGYGSMQRWAFRPDYGPIERAVVGDIEGRLLVPQVLSNIALEKTMTPETGAQWLQEQVTKLKQDREAAANK